MTAEFDYPRMCAAAETLGLSSDGWDVLDALIATGDSYGVSHHDSVLSYMRQDSTLGSEFIDTAVTGTLELEALGLVAYFNDRLVAMIPSTEGHIRA